jgi:hypothetical protein
MRRTLIDTQCKENNCAAGSWDPIKPKPDSQGESGGRIYMTSLAALTLEIYYRYLPMYKLDKEIDGEPAAAKPVAEKPAAKDTHKDDAKPATKAAGKKEAKAKTSE